jgi:small Trp-rich protein
MVLAVIAVLILIMKIAEFGPVAAWSWLWVLAPFLLLFVWWEVICPAIGWDKKSAERKMAQDMKAAEEHKRKQRGF